MKINNEKLRRAIEKLSEETMVSALEAYGISLEPPKFEPIEIHAGCFIVSAESDGVIIKTGDDYNGSCCHQTPGVVDEFITALQSAKDFADGIGLDPPKPKPEPKFEKIQFCHLRVDVPDPTNSFPIHLSWAGSENNTCLNSIKAIERHINGLQKAITFTQENNGQ